MTHIRGKTRATNNSAVLAERLPVGLLTGDWYATTAAVHDWLAEQGSDPHLAREVLDLAGYEAVASLREWLEAPETARTHFEVGARHRER